MGVNGLYGLSGSGLDIESMVKAGMLSKQNQYDKMYKKEVKNEWIKETYNEVYTKLNTFKYSTLSDYKMSSNMNAMGAESADTSKVKATANGDAVAMTHNINVTTLSTNAYLLTTNAGITRANTDSESSIYLRDNVFQSIKANGTDDDGNTLYDIVLAGGTTKTGIKGTDAAISFTVADADNTSAEDLENQTITYSFADLAEGKTYNDLAADIKNLGTNITATYDATNDSFSIYNSESGAEAKVSLTIAAEGKGGTYAAELFNNLHLGQSANGTLGTAKTFKAGDPTAIEGTGRSPNHFMWGCRTAYEVMRKLFHRRSFWEGASQSVKAAYPK